MGIPDQPCGGPTSTKTCPLRNRSEDTQCKMIVILTIILNVTEAKSSARTAGRGIRGKIEAETLLWLPTGLSHLIC